MPVLHQTQLPLAILLFMVGACVSRTDLGPPHRNTASNACVVNADCEAACIAGKCSEQAGSGEGCDDSNDCENELACLASTCGGPAASCGVTATSPALPYAAGDGTRDNPHLLCTAGQLRHLATANADHAKSFRLVADIDMSASDVEPIGGAAQPFTGEFDGNGHTIRGLRLSSTTRTEPSGLFSTADLASFHDLTLSDASVVVPATTAVGVLVGYGERLTIQRVNAFSLEVRGADNVGAVVGGCWQCLLDTVRVDAHVSGDSDVGGVAGWLGESVAVSVDADVVVTGTTEATGGFAGYLIQRDDLQDVHVRGSVGGGSQVGGLAGVHDGRQTYRSSFTGDVTGLEGVGGLAGAHFSFGCDLRSTWTDAVVTGETEVGGLLGMAYEYCDISDCFTRGVIAMTGSTPRHAGGIIGRYGPTLPYSVDRCYSTASVTGAADLVGGLIGETGTGMAVANCFYAGSLEGLSPSDAVGFGFGSVSAATLTGNQYWTGGSCTNAAGACNSTSVAAESVLANLQSPSSPALSSWDFTEIWREVPGSFPELRFQSQSPPVATVSCPVTATVGVPFACTFNVTDPDANEVQFFRYQPSTTCTWLVGSPRLSAFVLRATPSAADVGTCRLDVVVSDGTFDSPVQSVTISVAP